MITTLIVFGWIAAYGAMLGLTFKTFYKHVALPNFRQAGDAMPVSIIVGILWPIGLPAMIALVDVSRGGRAERRQARELTEAAHKVKLAKLESERTRELERAL